MIQLKFKGKKIREYDTDNIEVVIDEMQKECNAKNSLIFNSRNLWKVLDNKLIHETMVSFTEFEIVGEFKRVQKEYPKGSGIKTKE